jgi:hypothetical protein
MSSQVINIKTGSSIAAPVSTGESPAISGSFELRGTEPASEAVQGQLDDLRTIYGEPSASLSRAISIVTDAIAACSNAIEASDAIDKIKADIFMLQIQASLPELFEMRGIGDGFGIIVTALMFSFLNKTGSPFSKPQILAVMRALRALWSTPFVSVEGAAEVTDLLDQAGLIADPLPLTDLFVGVEEAGLIDG